MPSISTMVYPVPAYIRVEVNWADVPAATQVAVYRVDCATGARTPLRPYVSFNGDFLTLSCGYGIFWDTEAPLDTCFYYCTQALNAAGTVITTATDNLVTDTFTRTVANGWGTTDTLQVYTLTGGAAADYSVNGTQGGIALAAANVRRQTQLTGVSVLNATLVGQVAPTVVATGAQIDMGYVLRRDSVADTAYEFLLRFDLAGVARLRINSTVAGAATNIASFTLPTTYVATSNFTIVAQTWGNTVRARAYDTTLPDPMTWQIDLIDSTITTAGSTGSIVRLQAGNTNVPFTPRWDNLAVTDPCNLLTTVERCSDNLQVPSSHEFRLGDPVRPCNDVILRFLDDADPNCVPTQGIFFGNMSEEVTQAASSAFWPVNAVNPIVVNRSRRSLGATLTVATRTFPDRDALRALNAPGSPLFLRGPATYGIADRYMAVGDVTENRPFSDHKIAPRAVTLPHLITSRPSGPSQGVCGARVKDLCDIYPTIDALAASGLTWADLLRGKASNDTPKPQTVERTWTDVNATYADWNAVNSGNTDWTDLWDGP